MLASCFFLHVPDSMEGILDRVKDVGLISKLGGGVGLDISDLRPQGTRVKGTNGTSSGPVSFLKIFDACATQIEQGGLRRAALLACIRVDHPDVVQLIKAKEKEGEFKNFNFSILISDLFMNQLNTQPNTPWVFRFEDRSFLLAKDFSSIPFDGQPVVEKDYISAKDLWDIIINHAHANGEPGILFDDKIQAADPLAGVYGKLGVNPCSELTLLSGESCILGSINLSHMIKTTADGICVDFDKLDTTIKNAVRFLDNAIDVNFYPLDSIEKTTLKFRKIGLGTMGLHDLLLKLEYAYGENYTDFVDKLYRYIRDAAEDASTELGNT
jgi:ribonucleoside-diphosphate reductase alpha chain